MFAGNAAGLLPAELGLKQSPFPCGLVVVGNRVEIGFRRVIDLEGATAAGTLVSIPRNVLQLEHLVWVKHGAAPCLRGIRQCGVDGQLPNLSRAKSDDRVMVESSRYQLR